MGPVLHLGIDGGASSSAVRVEDRDGRVRFARTGGPINVSTLADGCWQAELDRLLHGCPEPTDAAVCLAGMRSDRSRGAVARHLHARFGRTRLRLEPDFAAALGCFAEPVTACAVAGTGSVVCSRAPDGALLTRGGTGHARDHGSAYRLGVRMIEHTGGVPSGSPRAVAAAAREITAAAEDGAPWAVAAVRDEMDLLAADVGAHLAAHHRDAEPVVGIVGGVWSSPAATAAFTDGLRARVPAAAVRRPVRAPVDAAVRLASEAAP